MGKRIRLFLLIFGLMVIAFVAGRTRSLPEAPQLPPLFDPVAIGLEGRRADVDLEEVTIDNAAAWISKAYGVQIAVEWAMLERDGLTRQSTVWLRMKQATLHEALLGLKTDPDAAPYFAYVIRGNTFVLTNGGDAARDAVTRIYAIRPIFRRMYGREGPEPDVLDAPDTVLGWPLRAIPENGSDFPTHEVFADFVCRVAQDATTGWKEDGGQIGSVRELGGYLFVTHQPYAHVLIARRLNGLAAQKPGEPLFPATQPGGQTP